MPILMTSVAVAITSATAAGFCGLAASQIFGIYVGSGVVTVLARAAAGFTDLWTDSRERP